jgi:hypothetical protein
MIIPTPSTTKVHGQFLKKNELCAIFTNKLLLYDSECLNAREYDGLAIEKECKTTQFQKRCTDRCTQQDEEEGRK